MKKFVSAVAVLALVAFAAPALAATNPFMDVPMNHWAYDAIGQLAAHGILSGYPDGTYKGKQPTTRYEMASALARALAVVDMTKASKQDVEMLQKLVVEFHDELEALGVTVADLEEKVGKLDSRLGGWKINGQLRLDIKNQSSNNAPSGDGDVTLSRAWLQFQRWFGEDESIHFNSIVEADGGLSDRGLYFREFYVDMPFVFDTKMTVGRTKWDLGADYYLGGSTGVPNVGGYAGLDSTLTDRRVDMFALEKQFGLGRVLGYVGHTTGSYFGSAWDGSTTQRDSTNAAIEDKTNYSAWEIFAMGQFQFTERFGLDLGGQAFLGDNGEPAAPAAGDKRFDNLWTYFVGLRFNFTDSVAFKAIYYGQQYNSDTWTTGWNDDNNDKAKHWRVALDVSQEALKFTSLWLEYGQYDAGFISPAGARNAGSVTVTAPAGVGGYSVNDDLKYFRAALGQKWNDKWATFLFYYHYDFDTVDDAKEYGLGVRYIYNANTSFGLNYVHLDQDNNEDNRVRFRTQVVF